MNCFLVNFAYVNLFEVESLQRKTFIRSSRAETFCKKGALKNFAKFTGKHLCQSIF